MDTTPQTPQPTPVIVQVQQKRGCMSWIGIAVVVGILAVCGVVGLMSFAARGKATATSATSVPPRGAQSVSAPNVSNDTSAAAAPSIVTVGQRAVAGHSAVTIEKMDQPDKLGEYQKPQAGTKFVQVQALIEAQDQQIDYNLYSFTVKDDNAVEYQPTLNTGTQGLNSGQIAPGDKVRGLVVFQVPENSKSLTLTYKRTVIIGDDEIIRVKLT